MSITIGTQTIGGTSSGGGPNEPVTSVKVTLTSTSGTTVTIETAGW